MIKKIVTPKLKAFFKALNILPQMLIDMIILNTAISNAYNDMKLWSHKMVEPDSLTDAERNLLCSVASYVPYSYYNLRDAYILSDKSFDVLFKAIKLSQESAMGLFATISLTMREESK